MAFSLYLDGECLSTSCTYVEYTSGELQYNDSNGTNSRFVKVYMNNDSSDFVYEGPDDLYLTTTYNPGSGSGGNTPGDDTPITVTFNYYVNNVLVDDDKFEAIKTSSGLSVDEIWPRTLECYHIRFDKMNPTEEERNYSAYMNVLQGLSLLSDTIETQNGERMTYLQWITDSTFNANTATWNRGFKQYDTIWSKVDFDTLGFTVDSTEQRVNLGGRPPKFDTIMVYDTTYIVKPWALGTEYVYPQIKAAIDSVWENHVSFYDLILGADGYSIEYKREYYINAELRIYDENGTYSSTDAKEISIN